MSRPKIKIDPTPADRVVEFIALAGVILTVGCVLASYSRLPEVIPIHFDAAGRPNGFGGKSMLLILPATAVGLYILMTVLARFPHLFNYPVRITEENAARQYRNGVFVIRVVKAISVLTMFYLAFSTVQVALGKAHGLGGWFLPVSLAATVGTVGFCIYRTFKLR